MVKAGGVDLFAHVRDMDGGKPLEVGQRVEFQAVSAPQGPRAENVRVT
jgi:cold shock CspA family protein